MKLGKRVLGEQAARLSSLPPLRTGRVPTSGGSEAFSQRRRAAHSLAFVCIYVRSCERAQRDAYVFVCVPRCILYGGCVSGVGARAQPSYICEFICQINLEPLISILNF
jgi:hypothetical protein